MKTQKMANMCLRIPAELLEKIRDAAYWSRITISSIAEEAFSSEVKKMERRYNSRAPFKKRKKELKGRRIN
ncbi:MAG: hypothetical protein ACXADY_26895 [Candidatus Hodarchaeales archaeon]